MSGASQRVKASRRATHKIGAGPQAHLHHFSFLDRHVPDRTGRSRQTGGSSGQQDPRQDKKRYGPNSSGTNRTTLKRRTILNRYSIQQVGVLRKLMGYCGNQIDQHHQFEPPGLVFILCFHICTQRETYRQGCDSVAEPAINLSTLRMPISAASPDVVTTHRQALRPPSRGPAAPLPGDRPQGVGP